MGMIRPGGVYETFGAYLPPLHNPSLGDLGQGFTPVVPSRSIGPAHGLRNLHFKLEQLNPTGSYKDRFAGLAVALAIQNGAKGCAATSSGNTGAAVAAMSAAFGLGCTLFVNENTPAAKLVQMRAYGARVIRVKGFGIDPRESGLISAHLREVCASLDIPFCVSAFVFCPTAMQGIKTIAYELHQQLGQIEEVFTPAGGGGLYLGIAKGFADLRLKADQVPRLNIVQARLNDTIVTPLNEGQDKARSVDTVTRISGLAVARDLDGTAAILHARRTGGFGVLVDDEEIFAVQRQLACSEGLLVEPAGAASVAGAIAAARAGMLSPHSCTVCILTGHGFKDTAALESMAADRSVELIDRAAISDALRQAAD